VRGRLVSVAGRVEAGTFTNVYQHDANGNRTASVIAATASTASFDARDRLLTLQSASGNVHFFYDLNGNLTNRVENGTNTFYRFNTVGQLLAVTSGSAVTSVVEYVYDPAGRQVGRKVNSAWSQKWVYLNDLCRSRNWMATTPSSARSSTPRV